MRRSIIVAVLLIASAAGIAVAQAPHSHAPGSAPDSAPAVPASEPYDDTVDITQAIPGEGRSYIVAYQAQEDVLLDFDLSYDISYEALGDHCTMDLVQGGAPVAYYQAVAAGEVPADPEDVWTAGGGGGGSSRPHGNVRVNGETLATAPGLPGTGGGGSGSNPGEAVFLAEGEWILFAAGVSGIDPSTFDADDEWTLTFHSTGPMEKLELDPAPLACGWGFSEHADTTVLGLVDAGDGSVAMETVYAARADIIFSFDAQMQGALVIHDERIPIDGMADDDWLRAFDFGPGPLAIEFEHDASTLLDPYGGPWWILSGI